MTVIKGNKAYIVSPGSTQASDTESLHLGSASASDTESLNNEPVTRNFRVFQALPLRINLPDDTVILKKASGKKKQRRYQNRYILQTLQEEDEAENLTVVVDSYKGPFTRLLEDCDALKFWNNFIEKSEEEQAEILNAFSEQYHKKLPCNDQEVGSLGRVSSRLKREFKCKKNLSIENVKDCELQLLEFFSCTPQSVYKKTPSNSFDRLLLRAMARYHGLEIEKKNISSSDEKSKPTIEIFNTKSNWKPANCFLTDFIEQLR